MAERTFLFELREAARQCSNVKYSALLKQVADSLEHALRQVYEHPTVDRMIEANCAWAHAQSVLKQLPPEGDPAPLSGPTEPARLAA